MSRLRYDTVKRVRVLLTGESNKRGQQEEASGGHVSEGLGGGSAN